jgi:hypothetical protein
MDALDLMEEIRDDLERIPPKMRDKILEQMLEQMLDSLPPDENIPPELSKKVFKALLRGGEGLEDLLDLPDFPLPGGGKRKKRRR